MIIKAKNPACGLIKETLLHYGVTQEQVSRDLEISKSLISSVVNYKRDVSAELALKLEAYLDLSAEFLLRVQNNWKLKRQEQEHAEDLARIRAKKVAA